MLDIYGERFKSRLLLGTAQYPSPATLRQAVEASSAEIVTVSLRRESARMRAGQGFWELIEDLGVRVLPNTAGCRTKGSGGDGGDGARAVRHAVDQARGHRQ